MRKFLVFSVIALAITTVSGSAILKAQDAPAAAGAAKASAFTSLLGEVTAVAADAKEMTLKPDTGEALKVALDAKTHFMKIAPGEKDLKKAADVQFSEIGVGDRVLARVRKLEGGSLSPATTVVVMTKASIAQHQEKTQAEWQSRGVVGMVTLVNAATKEITLKTPGAAGKQIVVEPADKVNIRKYAANSVKFSDAVPSNFAEIKSGDTIRVLGTKNEDGTRVVPEEIIYGTIVRQAGTILAIDAAAGTVKMTDLATKKPVTVKVDATTSVKRLTPMMATILAGGGRPAGAGGPGGPGAGAPGAGGPAAGSASGPGAGGAGAGGASSGPGMAGRPADGGQGRGPGGPGMGGPGMGGPGMGGPGGGGRNFDPARMMERLPAITIADLKAGDAIIVSSSGSKDPSLISAISVVAGVEALLTAPQKPGQPAGPNTSWNFEMSIPQ